MFIRPVESAVTTKVAEGIKNSKFISAYELIPTKALKQFDGMSDKFMTAEKEIASAPKSVLESITRIFW